MVWNDRTVRFRLAIASLLVFVLVTVLVGVHWSPVARLDRAISAWARRFGGAHPSWIDAWGVITHTGDTLPLSVLGGAAIILLLVSRRPLDAATVLVVAVVVQVITLGIRILLARHRPVDPFTPTSGLSYPSGHTLHSTVAVLLAVHLLKNDPQRRAVAWLLGSFAGLIGVSRVLLLAHWPTDVVGGWLLALGLGLLLPDVIATVAERRTPSRPPPSPAGPHTPEGPAPPSR
jgi:undecaprenyl-diphosphatase